MTSTKQFVTDRSERAEDRTALGTVTKKYFSLGESTGSSYFYAFNHLASVTEMLDSAGAIQAQYMYDAYGGVSKVSGILESDYQFASYYKHVRSGFNLAHFRPYDSDFGRFVKRDPFEEIDGTNVYAYLKSSPTNGVDPDGSIGILLLGGLVLGGGDSALAAAGALGAGLLLMSGMSSMGGAGAGSSGGGSNVLDFCRYKAFFYANSHYVKCLAQGYGKAYCDNEYNRDFWNCYDLCKMQRDCPGDYCPNDPSRGRRGGKGGKGGGGSSGGGKAA